MVRRYRFGILQGHTCRGTMCMGNQVFFHDDRGHTGNDSGRLRVFHRHCPTLHRCGTAPLAHGTGTRGDLSISGLPLGWVDTGRLHPRFSHGFGAIPTRYVLAIFPANGLALI